MSKWVVDASAVLAYLHQETGWQLVDEVLLAGECMISTVNYAEVAAKLAEKGMPEDAIRMALDCLNLQVIDFTSALALTSGLLRPATRSIGLSLGDRACLALAKQQQCPALTTDRIWETVQLEVEIKVIR